MREGEGWLDGESKSVPELVVKIRLAEPRTPLFPFGEGKAGWEAGEGKMRNGNFFEFITVHLFADLSFPRPISPCRPHTSRLYTHPIMLIFMV